MFFPVLLIGAGIATLLILSKSDERPVPVHEPDLPPVPGSTRYRKVDAILPELKKAAAASGIPLGLLVGWIARESAGEIGPPWPAQKPKPLKGEPDSERGYFQLTPSESKRLGISLEDHKRLSVEPSFSIEAGLKLVREYMKDVDKLTAAVRGSPYYWRLVKLVHTMGIGATKKILEGAKGANEAGSWEALKQHALDNEKKYLSLTKHSPSKWFPLVDQVYETGKPFGFGDETMVVGAGPAFTDIPDPLDCM